MSLPLERLENVFWILSVETFWGPALALISIVAILPFLTQLGATNTVISALPVVGRWPRISRARSRPISRRSRVPQAQVIGSTCSPRSWFLVAAWFGLGGRHAAALDIVVLISAWGGA
jgi:hypothetical protein